MEMTAAYGGWCGVGDRHTDRQTDNWILTLRRASEGTRCEREALAKWYMVRMGKREGRRYKTESRGSCMNERPGGWAERSRSQQKRRRSKSVFESAARPVNAANPSRAVARSSKKSHAFADVVRACTDAASGNKLGDAVFPARNSSLSLFALQETVSSVDWL